MNTVKIIRDRWYSEGYELEDIILVYLWRIYVVLAMMENYQNGDIFALNNLNISKPLLLKEVLMIY